MADADAGEDALDRAAQPAAGPHIQFGAVQRPAGGEGVAAGVARGNIASQDGDVEVLGYTEV